MAILEILTVGSPVLKERGRVVDPSREDITGLVDDLKETMTAAPGIGLAATQCGIMKRVLVFDIEEGLEVLVNPEIVEASDERCEDEEGCLSVPDVKITVERPERVRIRGFNELGAEVDYEADGMRARVIQHEVDHLDGVLILDRATREERKRAIRQQKEAERARASRL